MDNKTSPEDIYITKEDREAYADIHKKYKLLQETDGNGAFKLMKKAMTVYSRFNYIRYTVRRDASKGQYAAFKERLNGMCKFLDEVHTDARVTWKLCREDIKKEGD